ncbi:unnamed protein product [Protopolystoma xenopodis]|uniref:Uncharacterized protein n=1 Tax=Protopolystoma xenopodis TaxID=117903 RepID=A0A3S4ZN03_9PLAT|nr:unnamed protein product [Protopolystoma xenopodis]
MVLRMARLTDDAGETSGNPPDLDGFDVNGPGNASGALSQIDEIAAGTALPDPSVSTANVNSSVSASLSSPACLLPPALIDHTVHLTAPSSVGYVSASKVTDICTSGLPSRGHQQLQSAILTFETTWARAKSIWEQVVLCTEACESKARAAYLEWASSGFRYTSSSF